MRSPTRLAGGARLAAAAALVLSISACGSTGATPPPSQSPTPAPTPTTSPSSPPSSAVSPTGTSMPSASPTIGPAVTPAALIPDFAHVYVIILENKEYGRIVGAAQAPYENSLIARYGLTTNFFAETHPSEPNYIALTSGGLQGANSDGTYNLGAPNLFDQIEASGRTWHLYAQGYPGNCYKGSIANVVVDGPGASGDYARKHNPAISYTSISGNPARCSNITKLAGFDPAAADFEMIIPNQINDMHSSSVAAGDAFLKVFVPSIVNSPAFENSVLFITFDEGDSNLEGGGHIATLVASPGMAPGTRFATKVDHYSLLRTIEEAWGLPLLGQAQTATPITMGY